MQPAGGFEKLAGAGAVGGADLAVVLHEVGGTRRMAPYHSFAVATASIAG